MIIYINMDRYIDMAPGDVACTLQAFEELAATWRERARFCKSSMLPQPILEVDRSSYR